MSRIFIIYAGGTIGMHQTANGYAPSIDFIDRLSESLNCHIEGLSEFDIESIDPPIDSSDLTASDWNRLIQKLSSVWDIYDGFIILHGTDTMAYTASALSFLLGNIDKPIVITGSQIPLGEPRSDALNNIQLSIESSIHHLLPREVCIAFHDRILRGNRVSKCSSQKLGAFDSPNFPWIGESGVSLRFNPINRLPLGKPDLTTVNFEDDRVGVLLCHPGIPIWQATRLLRDDRLRGLVLMTYGVGNPPWLDGQLIPLLEEANERGLAIVNISQCPEGWIEQGAYATGNRLNKAGVIPCYDMTPEAAITKLQVLLARGHRGDDLLDHLRYPLRGEMTIPDYK